jgi:hypothetical protein
LLDAFGGKKLQRKSRGGTKVQRGTTKKHNLCSPSPLPLWVLCLFVA